MLQIKGEFGEATVFSDTTEKSAITQLYNLCNQEFTAGETIRIMPDVHAGAGCVIGTTMTVTKNRIVPNLVGVDVSCGLEVVDLGIMEFDNFSTLDKIIKHLVPCGHNIRKDAHPFAEQIDFESIKTPDLALGKAAKSIGTLGGGNHFIELDRGDDDHLYLVIHSGSRNIGLQIATHYQKIAQDKHPELPKDLAYVEGEDFDNYVHDMRIMQRFALLNRKAMADVICRNMEWSTGVSNWNAENSFTTTHNYVDLDNMILRKGAVSAQAREKLIIPFNMKDGSVICVGKGNADWNYSAPHGAGRICSRGDAKRNFSMDEFKEKMQGVYSSCVNEATIDESPMAYKPFQEIVDNMKDTVDVVTRLMPIYNYKAAEFGGRGKRRRH